MAKTLSLPVVILLGGAGLLMHGPASAEAFVWVVDPLVKVFRDTPPGTVGQVALQAARGEYESAQICVRSTGPLSGVRLALAELRGDAGGIPVDALTWHPVGYVPLVRNTSDTPEGELCRKAPTEVPDPLLPADSVSVAPGQTQPLWVTVHVPRAAAPGEYAGSWRVLWDGGEAPVEVRLTVWPFEMPAEQHLAFTNWISPDALARHHGVEPYSEAFWELLGKYARAAADHHQNVLWLGLNLVGLTEEPAGGLSFDWTGFDRWVEVVSANGCGRLIEIQPLGHWAKGDWSSTQIELSGYGVRTPDGGTKTLSAEECLPKLLPALQEHLAARGWLERTVLHIADEPAVHHVTSWRAKAQWVHSLAPRIRRIDAIEAPDFGDDLEVWVPKLNHLYNWLPHYDAARAAGKEVWFYTCCHPTGLFPNRFLDLPLVKTRILQWVNWRYRLSGYLHWGLNFWDDDPLHSTGNPNLPPGDCWIVYPGPDGPLSSLRWEALRDGFEDYELLWTLADRHRRLAAELEASPDLFSPEQRSDELACQLVRTMIDTCRDPAELRQVRQTIASEIGQAEAAPRALVAVDPPAHHPLAVGPIVVATRIWTEEGAEVRVNGAGAHRQPDGHWAHHTFLGAAGEVRVEVKQGEATKLMVRSYRVTAG